MPVRWRLRFWAKAVEYTNTEFKQMMRIRSNYTAHILKGTEDRLKLPRWFRFEVTGSEDSEVETKTPMCDTNADDYKISYLVEQFRGCHGNIANSCQTAASFLINYQDSRNKRLWSPSRGYPNDPTHMVCCAIIEYLVEVAKKDDFKPETLIEFSNWQNFIESLNEDAELFPIDDSNHSLRQALSEVHRQLEETRRLIKADIDAKTNGDQARRLKKYLETIKTQSIHWLVYLQSCDEVPNIFNLKVLEDPYSDQSAQGMATRRFFESTLHGSEAVALIQSIQHIEAPRKRRIPESDPKRLAITDQLALTVRSNESPFIFDTRPHPLDPELQAWQLTIDIDRESKRDVIYSKFGEHPSIRNEIKHLMGLIERLTYFGLCCAQADKLSGIGGEILLNLVTLGATNQLAADGEEIIDKILSCCDDIMRQVKNMKVDLLRVNKSVPATWERNFKVANRIYEDVIRPSLISAKACFVEILKNAEYWQKNAPKLLEEAVQEAEQFTGQVATIHHHLQAIGMGRTLDYMPTLPFAPQQLLMGANAAAAHGPQLARQPLLLEAAPSLVPAAVVEELDDSLHSTNSLVEEVIIDTEEQDSREAGSASPEPSRYWRLHYTMDLLGVFSSRFPETARDIKLEPFSQPSALDVYREIEQLQEQLRRADKQRNELNDFADKTIESQKRCLEHLAKTLRTHLLIQQMLDRHQALAESNQAYQYLECVIQLQHTLSNNIVALQGWHNNLGIQLDGRKTEAEAEKIAETIKTPLLPTIVPAKVAPFVAVQKRWYHYQPIYRVVQFFGDLFNMNPIKVVANTSAVWSSKFLNANRESFSLAAEEVNRLDDHIHQLYKESSPEKLQAKVEDLLVTKLSTTPPNQEAVKHFKKIVTEIDSKLPSSFRPFVCSRRKFLFKLRQDCLEKMTQVQLSTVQDCCTRVKQDADKMSVQELQEFLRLIKDVTTEHKQYLSQEKAKFSMSIRHHARAHARHIEAQRNKLEQEQSMATQLICHELTQKLLSTELSETKEMNIRFLKNHSQTMYQFYVRSQVRTLTQATIEGIQFADTARYLNALQLKQVLKTEFARQFELLRKQPRLTSDHYIEIANQLRWLCELDETNQYAGTLLQACQNMPSNSPKYREYLIYLCNADAPEVKNTAQRLLVAQFADEILNGGDREKIQHEAMTLKVDELLTQLLHQKLGTIFESIVDHDYHAVLEDQLEQLSVYLAHSDPAKIIREMTTIIERSIETCDELMPLVFRSKDSKLAKEHEKRFSTAKLVLRQIEKLNSHSLRLEGIHEPLENLRRSIDQLDKKLALEFSLQIMIENDPASAAAEPQLAEKQGLWQDYVAFFAQVSRDLKNDRASQIRCRGTICGNILQSMFHAGLGHLAAYWQQTILHDMPIQTDNAEVAQWCAEFRRASELPGIPGNIRPNRYTRTPIDAEKIETLTKLENTLAGRCDALLSKPGLSQYLLSYVSMFGVVSEAIRYQAIPKEIQAHLYIRTGQIQSFSTKLLNQFVANTLLELYANIARLRQNYVYGFTDDTIAHIEHLLNQISDWSGSHAANHFQAALHLSKPPEESSLAVMKKILSGIYEEVQPQIAQLKGPADAVSANRLSLAS